MGTYVFWFLLSVIVITLLGPIQIGTYLRQMKKVPRPGPPSCGDILIVGSSIDLGYGASSSWNGFAGQLARMLGKTVEVVAVPFKGTKALLAFVPKADRRRRYEAVVLNTSCNDFMSQFMGKLEKTLTEMLLACRAITEHVVVVGNFHNLHRAKYFRGYWLIPLVLRTYFRWQGNRVEGVYKKVIKDLGGESAGFTLVEIQVPMLEGDTSVDGVHPSDLGHELFARPVAEVLRPMFKWPVP